MISQIFLLCCVVLCTGGGFEEECGLEAVDSTPLVRGGLRVKANQFPWHVAIFHRKKNNDFELDCGGSLVRSDLVISAAHCFSDRLHSHQVHVADYRIVGGVRLSSWDSTDTSRQESEVREIRLGEYFGSMILNMEDDISIIYLTTRFTFSDTVRAVCLDLTDTDLYTNQTRPGSVGKVAGWGLTESGVPSDSLNFLRVPVVAREECLDKLPRGYRSFFTSDKICAGLTNGSAVCKGDSGGGLVFPLQNTSAGTQRWFLRGVVSNAPTPRNLSDPCLANVFALYTDIYKHRMWLTTQMNENLPREGCRVKGGTGVCREVSACPRAIEEIARGILPQYCSPSNKICCVEFVVETCPPLPPSAVSQRKTGSKAHDYCIELAEKIHPCQKTSYGWFREDLCPLLTPDSNIVYHKTPITTTAEVPYYGLIGTGQRGDILWWRVYPVSLVSDQWVLCSAYAIIVLIDSSRVNFIGLGGAFRPQYNPDEIFNVTTQHIHPLYNNSYSSVYNGIALLQLDRRVTFTAKILPACLHTGTPLPDSGFILTGWDSYSTSRHHKTTMQRLSQEECSRAVPTDSYRHPAGVKHDQEICSRPVNTTARCRGWYEGTLLTLLNSRRVKCTHLLVGLNSFGITSPCTITNTRISSFIPWIEGIVWP